MMNYWADHIDAVNGRIVTPAATKDPQGIAELREAIASRCKSKTTNDVCEATAGANRTFERTAGPTRQSERGGLMVRNSAEQTYPHSEQPPQGPAAAGAGK